MNRASELLSDLSNDYNLCIQWGEDVDGDPVVVLDYSDHDPMSRAMADLAEVEYDEGGEVFVAKGSLEDITERLNNLCDDPESNHFKPSDLDFWYDEETMEFRIKRDDFEDELFGIKDGVVYTESWDCCSDCGLFVDTSPGSYCDHGRYLYEDDGLVCRSCIEKDPAGYLERYLEKEERRGPPSAFILDPGSVGFVRVGPEHPYQNGWHTGMTDDPDKIRSELIDNGIEDVVFSISPSQFYVDFTVWVRPENQELANRVLQALSPQ